MSRVLQDDVDAAEIAGRDDLDTRLRVTADGVVRWNQLMRHVTTCNVFITFYPFDSQKCSVDMVFWTLTTSEVSLVNHMADVSTESYHENADWFYDGSSSSISSVQLCCPTTEHPVFTVTFQFSRRRPYHIMNSMLPILLLSLCMVFTFLIPTESGERVSFSLTITLAFTVQLTTTNQEMPHTSLQVPYLAKYMLGVLVLNSLVIASVVLNVKLFFKEGDVYPWLKVVYRKLFRIAYPRCCSKRRYNSSRRNSAALRRRNGIIETVVDSYPELGDDKHETEENPKPGGVVLDDVITWTKVSKLLDRLGFYAFASLVALWNIFLIAAIS